MGEILPDGSIQGYFKTCEICGKEIESNIQGSEMGKHVCKPIPKIEINRSKNTMQTYA